ncbi:hypothetical protein GGX14DRAFT_671205 [Mycena pura]|uniref:Large ribosomal subunit protein mL59 domain-containing protein n=1 Tax=Mycena pura TaxID=153505 RepID=A0AAD6YJE8_9AGAR|nr:hypothetical protein GGX14DRAFT_671205 [Mycena pura]
MSAKFLQRELKALPRFVRRNGPLPAPQSPATPIVLPNPFLPWRNPKTGRWAPPKYSLRQQADLVKRAKASGTLHVLPPSIKVPQPELFAPPPAPEPVAAGINKGKGRAKAQQAQASLKLRTEAMVTVEWDRRPAVKPVRGADNGARLYAAKKRMFKGSKRERARTHREWRTWVLLHDMRKRIRRYRNNYVHRKPNPLKPARGMQKKLPF